MRPENIRLAVRSVRNGLDDLEAIAEWHATRGCPPPNVRIERNPSGEGYVFDFYVATGEPNAWLASESYVLGGNTVVDVILAGPDEIVDLLQRGQIAVAAILPLRATAFWS